MNQPTEQQQREAQLRFQVEIQRLQACMNNRIHSALEFLSAIDQMTNDDGVVGEGNPDALEQLEKILCNEAGLASRFLQEYCRLIGKPLVLASRSDLKGVNFASREGLEGTDGITIVTPCDGQMAKRLVEAFNNIARNKGKDGES